MDNDRYNLFVYGSLRDPNILKSVCGYSFSLKKNPRGPQVLHAELAILPGYQKVSPDNVYYYATPQQGGRIEGFLIYGLPASAVEEVDAYEGKFYDRGTVTVNTASGSVESLAYLGSLESLARKFGDRWHVNLIHELWLRKRITNFFKSRTRPGEKSHDAEVERRARRELLGTTERDLVISHLGSDVVSDFYLENELDRPFPTIRHLFDDDEARPYLPNYVALVIKQIILNQFEHKLHSRYRYDLEQLGPSRRFYTRSISLLIALRMINANPQTVDLILGRGLETMPLDGNYDLLDYVKYAIRAADSMFDSRVGRSELFKIHNNCQPGLTPLGAEVELSNLGFKAISEKNGEKDSVFDNFQYFSDFGLDIMTWKLGGYIDDHSGDSDPDGKRGFLELAPGRLSRLGDLSKPATNDPWILNQLIKETTKFYPIGPHSLHISLQLRKRQIGKQKVLRPGFVKCLLALGGDPQRLMSGKMWISRMGHDEIKQYRPDEELVFARTSKRKYHRKNDFMVDHLHTFAPTYVQQYKFIRLNSRANFEPLILALKGLQISCNPADYLTIAQLEGSQNLRNIYAELKDWANAPTPINRNVCREFLQAVQHGLMNEGHHKPVHKLHYIDWALSATDVQLRLFNKQLAENTRR
ncbi:AIG2-like family protein [Anaerohalosphaera lusitana]|uniref:Putative gamma-glutamylcyclotransferase n=1 Tax=Anaerohalosphaera lusitana TaxID=1936003 RepID=A0A1U9NM68_9BACT|nr:gamma-glutamylcyclotransferase family protein [Anaerohalosphaera lusitana]AQT69003.1 AIG2-like family protein [Anaerohalosphaera lusitana]